MHSLDQADVDVSGIMRGLVHELRNPLSAILTASSLLQGNPQLDEETDMLLDVVKKESKRMNRILTEFAAFVKPSVTHVEAFDLALLTRDLLQEMSEENHLEPGIAIVDNLEPILGVLADPIQTRRALTNIITNANEAVGSTGTISLLSRRSSNTVEIEIRDTGGAMEDSMLKQAFQPFFSTRPQGTGLGLPIARELVRSSGGDITLASESNCAVVTVRLPAHQLGIPEGTDP